MALSGWCSTHERRQCERCAWAGCGHWCHGANPAQQSQEIGGERGKIGAQVKTAPGVHCVNSERDSQGLARRYEGAPD